MNTLFKNYKRKLIATVIGAFLLLLAFPTLASASQAAITSFSMDRTTVTQGQTITFTVTTTAQVNYVFANVGNNRVATGTRTTGNTWQVVVTPAVGTQGITIVANTSNNINNAATVFVPVTVTSTGQQNVPPVPTGPLAIHSITETTALREGEVQLTVVTGPDAREVWVQFDDTRFMRARGDVAELRTATSRTWVINFRPARWAPQSVTVSSNTAYVVTGAVTQNYNITLSAPFVRAAVPAIQNVTVSSRDVAPNGTTTFTIRTNADVNYVWVENVNGTRTNATRTAQTAASRTWTVTFSPVATGQARVFANATNTAAGAVTRNENITVRAQNASIVSTPTVNWVNWSNSGTIWVEVTTNQFAQRVWLDLPDGRRPQLTLHSGSGSANRVWRGYIENISNLTQINIRVSETNNFNTDYSRNVTISGVRASTNVQQTTGNMALTTGGQGWMSSATISHSGNLSRATITVNTLANINVENIRVHTPHNGDFWLYRVDGNPNQWTVSVNNFMFTQGQTMQFTFDPIFNGTWGSMVSANWVGQ